MTIIVVSARITLQQIFHNTSENSTSRAKYVFPVPARAAVCAFEMRMGDGRVVIGLVKEKTNARKEHEQAIQRGKSTALIEWATDDGECD